MVNTASQTKVKAEHCKQNSKEHKGVSGGGKWAVSHATPEGWQALVTSQFP